MASNFGDLRATFINCSLARDASSSHTMRLLRRSAGIMRDEGVAVDVIHALDHFIAFGMEKDLGDVFGPRDEWPEVQRRIMAADILVLATPIWLGFTSSVLSMVIERHLCLQRRPQREGAVPVLRQGGPPHGYRQ